MNAIISLCHFCESHGPSVLFCTQALHSNKTQLEDETDKYESMCNCRQQATVASTSWPTAAGSAATAGTAGSSDGLSQTSSVMETSATCATAKPKPSDTCEACRSLPSELPGYISRDPEASVCYVSSQYPQHPGVYTIVRQACLRSLSHEVCPGREGPIYFGDDRSCQVLSHTFVLNDENARGLQRLYSIIIVMTDKIFLLSSWPFLISHLQKIIEQIKAKADSITLESMQHREQRVSSSGSGIGRPAALLGNQPRTRKTSKLRSFVDITNDANIFEKLHQAFSSLLKAGGSRLTERLLEGPPTEDSVIDLDRQEDTDEGFVKLYRMPAIELHLPTTDGFENSDEYNNDDEDDYDDDSDKGHKPVHVFTGLLSLLKVLGYSRFHMLAHHVVIGSHIVVRARHRELVRSVIDALKMLLPKGCCQAVYFTKNLEDWKYCNFIGMPLHVTLPENPPGVDVVIEISEPSLGWSDFSTRGKMLDSMIEPSIDQISELKSRHYNIDTLSNKVLPSIAPTVLQKIEKTLMSEQLAESVVEQCIICLKEEWMSKVKVMYKFTKIGGSRSKEDTQKLLRIVGAKEEDKVILNFWMHGLSDKYRSIQS